MFLPGRGPESSLGITLPGFHMQAGLNPAHQEGHSRLVGFSKEWGCDVTLREDTYTVEGSISQLELPDPDRESSQTAQALNWGGTQA